MNRLNIIREKIEAYPVPKPIFTLQLDHSKDLCFRQKTDKIENIYEDSLDYFENAIAENIKRTLQKQEDGTQIYVNDPVEVISSIMADVKGDLVSTLKSAMPNQEPKRTKVYKWFMRYNTQTDAEREFLLAMKVYTETNPECKMDGTKHAEAFIGLVHHLWSKYGK